MAFDPCREWLGIDAVDLGDPCRVLGLPAGCRDAAAIGQAAEGRLHALRQVAPGPFAKAHSALVTRVEEARDAMLAAAFSGGPTTPAMEPRPAFAPTRPSFAPAHTRWAGVDDAASGGSPAGFPPSADEPEPMLGPAARRAPSRSRSPSSGAGGLLLTSFALLAAAVAVLVFLMLRPDPFGGQVAIKKPTQPTKPPVANGTKPPSDEPQPRQPSPPRQPEMTAPTTPPATGGSAPGEATTPDPGRDDEQAERRRQEAEKEKQKQEAERRRAQEEQASREAEMAEQKAAAAKREAEEKRLREEMAAKEAARTTDQERARMQEALDKSLRDAFTALQRGEFDTADRAIAAGGEHVGDDVEAATRIERWRLLATYAREFVGFREQAIASANAGREFQIDGKPFAVIEITPDLFVYKMAGKIERVPRERVDPRVELAVVEGWFEADGRAANHLFLGARWLCLDPPNPARAKREWQIAGDGGEQVDPLNALLDDPVIRRAGR